MGFAIQLVTSDNNNLRFGGGISPMEAAESGKKQIKGWIRARVVKKLSGSR